MCLVFRVIALIKVPSPNKAHRKYFKNRSTQCGTNSIISSTSIITCNSYVVCLALSCLVTMQRGLSAKTPILQLKVFIKRQISLDNYGVPNVKQQKCAFLRFFSCQIAYLTKYAKRHMTNCIFTEYAKWLCQNA